MKLSAKYILMIITILFTLTAMSVMVLFLLNRNADAEGGYLTSGENPDGDIQETEKEMFSGKDAPSGVEGYLCIPLEDGTKEEDVLIKSDAGKNVTTITIPISDSEFYYKNNLSGSRENIESVEFDISEKTVIFDIKTGDGMLPDTRFEKNGLFIRFDPLNELYDRIVVIDAGHGGEDTGTEAYDILEKDVTLGVAEEIRALNEEGIFFTRTEDVDMSDKDRVKAAQSMGAQLMITLHTNADKSTRITRGMEILYSDDSVKPLVQELAAKLEDVADESGVSVIKKADTGYFEDLDMPCIVIKLGYMTNKAEALMLGQEEYQKKTALAIAEAIEGKDK